MNSKNNSKLTVINGHTYHNNASKLGKQLEREGCHYGSGRGRGVYQSYYKGHMDKIKGEGGGGGGRWVWLGWGGRMGRKMQTTVIE